MLIVDTVSVQIYKIIRRMILEHELLPGQRIESKEIAEKYEVSVMPVRSALERLTTQGLVITKPRVGIFVREFTNEELFMVSDTRRMFETYCLYNYCHKLDRAEMKKIRNRLLKASVDDVELLRELDDELHGLFIKSSGNTFLEKQYEEMNVLFNMAIYIEKSTLDLARVEHISILDAILAGNVNSAVKLLEEHLERASTEIINYNTKRKMSMEEHR